MKFALVVTLLLALLKLGGVLVVGWAWVLLPLVLGLIPMLALCGLGFFAGLAFLTWAFWPHRD